jgi:hypothetical protein
LARSLAAATAAVAASRQTAGGAAGDGGNEAAVGLQSLSLGVKLLPPGLGDALAAMPQLTDLSVRCVRVLSADCTDGAQLSRLIQLRRLELSGCTSSGLAAVLPALTSLTNLCFEAAGNPISTAQFRFEAPAPALQKVTLLRGKLDVDSFAQLPALESLDVPLLSASDVPPPNGWRMPEQLRELTVRVALTVKLLSQLRASNGLVVRTMRGWPMSLPLDRDLHDGDALLQEGEAALRRALRFLAKHLAEGTDVALKVHSRHPLLPLGGHNAVGPGRANHAWLAELGGLPGPHGVRLRGWRLSAQDLEALSRLATLQGLNLRECAVAPLSALPLLARSSCLARLELDVRGLIGPAPAEAEAQQVAQAGQLRAAVVALFAVAGWRGWLCLRNIPARAAQARAELAMAQGDLAAVGVAAEVTLQ